MKLRYVLSFLSLVHAMFMFYDLGWSLWEHKVIKLDWYSLLLGRERGTITTLVGGRLGLFWVSASVSE